VKTSKRYDWLTGRVVKRNCETPDKPGWIGAADTRRSRWIHVASALSAHRGTANVVGRIRDAREHTREHTRRSTAV